MNKIMKSKERTTWRQWRTREGDLRHSNPETRGTRDENERHKSQSHQLACALMFISMRGPSKCFGEYQMCSTRWCRKSGIVLVPEVSCSLSESKNALQKGSLRTVSRLLGSGYWLQNDGHVNSCDIWCSDCFCGFCNDRVCITYMVN